MFYNPNLRKGKRRMLNDILYDYKDLMKKMGKELQAKRRLKEVLQGPLFAVMMIIYILFALIYYMAKKENIVGTIVVYIMIIVMSAVFMWINKRQIKDRRTETYENEIKRSERLACVLREKHSIVSEEDVKTLYIMVENMLNSNTLGKKIRKGVSAILSIGFVPAILVVVSVAIQNMHEYLYTIVYFIIAFTCFSIGIWMIIVSFFHVLKYDSSKEKLRYYLNIILIKHMCICDK